MIALSQVGPATRMALTMIVMTPIGAMARITQSAKPIDWLAVTLRFIDPAEKSILDEEVEDHELDIVDPEGVLEGLDNDDLAELEKEIENYLTLETSKSNRDYWNVSVCAQHRLDITDQASHSKSSAKTFGASLRLPKPKHAVPAL